MAIKINNTTVIYDDTATDFYFVNPGAYTKSELASLTGSSVGSFVFCSDKGEQGALVHWDGSKWLGVIAAEGSGGDFETTPGNGYKYHTFINDGTFTITSAGPADVLVVAGGGGTGPFNDSRNGGAGGGGVAFWPQVDLPTGSYSIIVGGRADGNTGPAGKGKDSIFGDGNSSFSVIAKGGGEGGGGPRYPSANPKPAGDGGSGGGGSGFDANTPSGNGIQPTQNSGRAGLLQYGNDGGLTDSGGSEGGGGAGEVGYPSNPSNPKRGRGGDGIQIPGFDIYSDLNIPGATANMNSYFGGGGNGNSAYQQTIRPLGGGGQSSDNTVGEPGVDYTGGGAGGGGGGAGGGCYGGRGLVVIRTEA